MAEWLWMPFGAVSGVSRGTDVLDWVNIVKLEGALLGVNVEHPIVTASQRYFGISCFLFLQARSHFHATYYFAHNIFNDTSTLVSNGTNY